MCMAIPARVITIGAQWARVATETHEFEAGRLLVPELAVGDWVLVNTGQIITRLTPEEAEATRELIQALRAADDP